MRDLLLSCVLMLTGCPKAAPEAVLPTWLPLGPALPALCVPSPDLRAVMQSMVDVFDPRQAPTLLGYADAHPDDACAAHTAGVVAAMMRQQDTVLRLDRALALAPDQPETLLARAIVGIQTGESGERVDAWLQHGLERAPDHPGLLRARMARSIQEQDLEAALVDALAVRDAGVDDESLLIFHLMQATGDRAGTVREAARLGLPLGVDGLQDHDDPLGALAAAWGLGEGQALVASLGTSLGTVHCRLFHDDAPVTVATFVGLARGTLPWIDPDTGKPAGRPLYDGTPLHRVIPDFMIQGGDPTGSGSGGAGWSVPTEASAELSFDRPGRLATANHGPDTNGSQFFITEVPTPHLDGKHSLFGQCGDLDVVQRLARVPRGPDDRPETPLTLHQVTVQAMPQDDALKLSGEAP